MEHSLGEELYSDCGRGVCHPCAESKREIKYSSTSFCLLFAFIPLGKACSMYFAGYFTDFILGACSFSGMSGVAKYNKNEPSV